MSDLRLAYILGQAAREFRVSQVHARSAMQREHDPAQPHDRDHAAGREEAYGKVLLRLREVIEEASAGG